jgi:hypothetical protein
MKYLAIILLLLVSSADVEARPDCGRHPIFCKIVELRPSIDKAFAMEASNYIHASSKHYGTDPMESVAIIHQESSWREALVDAYVVHQNGSVGS